MPTRGEQRPEGPSALLPAPLCLQDPWALPFFLHVLSAAIPGALTHMRTAENQYTKV